MKSASIIELINYSAQQYPNKNAIEDGHSAITYHELNNWSNTIALSLSRAELDNRIIAVQIPRSASQIAVYLGILKAGCAYLPVANDIPDNRLEEILKQANVSVFIGAQDKAQHAPNKFVNTESLSRQALSYGSTNLPFVFSEDLSERAYVIFTSGSTGQPKGIEVAHHSLSAMTTSFTEQFSISHRDRMPVIAGEGFDAAVAEIWPALVTGATLVVANANERRSPSEFLNWLQTREISFAWAPTVLVEALLQLDWEQHPADLPQLRYLITAGEQLKARPPANFPAKLYNCYGPSECTVIASCGLVEPEATGQQAFPHIGTALSFSKLYLFDCELNEVGDGEQGQLYIGGEGVAMGYINNQALTDERFIQNPTSREESDILYATGDICYRDTSGNLHFIGREDDQVNIDGFRVELSEITQQLLRCGGVRQAAVVAAAAESERSQIIAYFQGEVTEQQLCQLLQEQLPRYMVPSHFVAVDAFPLTPNGKIDIKALPQPSLVATMVDKTDWSEETTRLAKIAGKVLNRAAFDPYTSLFAQGANSLLATMVLEAVERELGVKRTISQLFNEPRLGHLLDSKFDIEEDNIVEVRPDPDGSLPSHKPLTAAQEQIYTLCAHEPENRAYHARAIMTLKGKLNAEALRDALNAIVINHECYRSTYIEVDGIPCQVAQEPFEVDLSYEDLSSLGEQTARAKAYELICGAVDEVFDITQLPLVRWKLVKTAEQTFELLHVEHHLVHDGWSYTVFLRELMDTYQERLSCAVPPARQIQPQIGDYAKVQKAWLRSSSAQQQEQYWKQKLENSPQVIDLPLALPREERKNIGTTIRHSLDREFWERTEKFAAAHNVTAYSLVLAVMTVVFGRYSNQDDISIGSGFANRRWKGSENIIGMIINMLVMRNRIDQMESFSSFLKRVGETVSEALEHQELPFGRVVEVVNPPRAASYNPLFQVALGFHDAPLPDGENPSLFHSSDEALGQGYSKFDMQMTVIPSATLAGAKDEAKLIWEFNSSIIAPEVGRSVFESLLRVWEFVLDSGATPVKTLPCLRANDSAITGHLREVATDHSGVAFHQAVRLTARRFPDAIALQERDKLISYAELDRQSDRVARHLVQQGLETEQLVGMYFDQTSNYIISLLGVIKAGGAFVPLDKEHPQSRLEFICNDAGFDYFLCQSEDAETLNSMVRGYVVEVDKVLAGDDITGGIALPTPKEDALCYSIYTSGTTGYPKGVLVEHSNLVHYCEQLNTYIKNETGSDQQRYGWNNSLIFDGSLCALSQLFSGGTIVFLSAESRTAPEVLTDEFEQYACTISNLTPTQLHYALEYLDSVGKHWTLPSLIVAGESISEAMWTQLSNIDSQEGRMFFNGYGPTECTVGSSFERISHSTTPNIGHVLDNVYAVVVNEALAPLPYNTRGELLIAGRGVARGYLNRPELTEEKFVSIRLADGNLHRFYRTGDIVRLRSDGKLSFVGRDDDQVKVRGVRIELEEINATLKAIPGLSDSRVLATQSDDYNTRVIAFVRPDSSAPPINEEQILASLSGTLPSFLQPSQVVIVDSFAISGTGKVDKKLLLELAEHARSSVEQLSRSAPATPTEHLVHAEFVSLLEAEDVCTSSDFFSVGGHSLLATKLLWNLNRECGTRITIKEMYNASTIASLASLIDETKERNNASLSEEELMDVFEL
ncbi:amino acid adenylation domain-containing protein [Corallincola holothuriorum]|uniref:Amino acid adenylation domain-containing protein n=1 Tax=Corallincola holothuriorum TaxID=2282215 RepID=A0A368NQR4_9GAMM|nr:non-ribosomal peptide synthetase [Corallincola holothuriorum]RCU52486.1 amino acid adenylation domain-containing protein [Corallincola holothuriorum]